MGAAALTSSTRPRKAAAATPTRGRGSPGIATLAAAASRPFPFASRASVAAFASPIWRSAALADPDRRGCDSPTGLTARMLGRGSSTLNTSGDTLTFLSGFKIA